MLRAAAVPSAEASQRDRPLGPHKAGKVSVRLLLGQDQEDDKAYHECDKPERQDRNTRPIYADRRVRLSSAVSFEEYSS